MCVVFAFFQLIILSVCRVIWFQSKVVLWSRVVLWYFGHGWLRVNLRQDQKTSTAMHCDLTWGSESSISCEINLDWVSMPGNSGTNLTKLWNHSFLPMWELPRYLICLDWDSCQQMCDTMLCTNVGKYSFYWYVQVKLMHYLIREIELWRFLLMNTSKALLLATQPLSGICCIADIVEIFSEQTSVKSFSEVATHEVTKAKLGYVRHQVTVMRRFDEAWEDNRVWSDAGNGKGPGTLPGDCEGV